MLFRSQGGTHLTAFREHVSRTIKEFSGKGYEYSDIRNGMVAAVSVGIQEPVFESQTKTRLGSKEVEPGGTLTVNKFIGDFLKKELDDFLHKNPDIAEAMLTKISRSEKERKSMAGVAKLAREKAKKVSLHNRKLRDCLCRRRCPQAAQHSRSAGAVDSSRRAYCNIRQGDYRAATGKPSGIRQERRNALRYYLRFHQKYPRKRS